MREPCRPKYGYRRIVEVEAAAVRVCEMRRQEPRKLLDLVPTRFDLVTLVFDAQPGQDGVPSRVGAEPDPFGSQLADLRRGHEQALGCGRSCTVSCLQPREPRNDPVKRDLFQRD